MTRPVRVGVQLWPGGAPDYRSWRAAAVQPEELGADLVFGYDHFDAPAMKAIGGSGEKRTLPAVARHADIWHTFLRIDRFNRASKIVAELATADGRNDSDIERSSVWESAGAADTYRDAGVTLFTTEIHPTAAAYDFSTLEKMIAWRDAA